MSSLTDREKRCFERLFDMEETGKVFDYTDQNYNILFKNHNIDINDEKYLTDGRSQTERMRIFWDIEDDKIVADVLSEILNSYESDFDDRHSEPDIDLMMYGEPEHHIYHSQEKEICLRRLKECKDIVDRLYGDKILSAKILIDYANSHDFKSLLDQINQLDNTVESNPRLAIGTAKELLEAVCKTILIEDYNIQPQNEILSLPKLVKRVSKELGLLPEDIPDDKKGSDAIRRILNSLAQVTQGVAELRNLYGTGHGHSSHRQSGIQPRHARLVVNSVITVVTFWIETFDERQKSET